MQVDQDIKNNGINPKNMLFKPDINKFYTGDMFNSTHTLGNNTMSMLNHSSMMTNSKIICCFCSATIEANTKGMCETCARSEVNIIDGMAKTGLLHYCK